MSKSSDGLNEYQWTPQPEAAALVAEIVDSLCRECPAAATLARRMHEQTGTRLVDWIDHFMMPHDAELTSRLESLAFENDEKDSYSVWRHSGGMFPDVVVHSGSTRGCAIKVDSVADFLVAHNVADAAIIGDPMSPLRKAKAWSESNNDVWVIERHGYRGFDAPTSSSGQTLAALAHGEAFRRRKRNFASDEDGFNHASNLIRIATDDLGVDWACALFFAAEREYWQRRNRAARIQKARQDALGLGWGNHDHHTYRSSREHFTKLIAALEQLGFVCRERFYGGSEAGWGAQVLEQPNCGIVIFADVDLTPDEVTGDFAHEGLAPQSQLGTVGLWCKLHGEAFLQAGLHHLECQFAFDAARKQLREQGIQSMEPFTNFDYLKQCFTEGEVWLVAENRIEAALQGGFITSEQADRFRRLGAVGSHLEILQRDEGYKGFNQTGVSEIIAKTDPRKLTQAAVS